MTNEEAIEIIKNIYCSGGRGNGKLMLTNAFRKALIALETVSKYWYILGELNTPTKPGRGMDGYYYCPTCGKMLQEGNDNERESECSRCRQSIKWGTEDD